MAFAKQRVHLMGLANQTAHRMVPMTQTVQLHMGLATRTAPRMALVILMAHRIGLAKPRVCWMGLATWGS